MKAYLVYSSEYYFEDGERDSMDREYYFEYEQARSVYEKIIQEFKESRYYNNSMRFEGGENSCIFHDGDYSYYSFAIEEIKIN